MSKYGHRPGNWLESVINKMGGEEAADRFLRSELTLVEVPPFKKAAEYRPWMSIALGEHKTPQEYRVLEGSTKELEDGYGDMISTTYKVKMKIDGNVAGILAKTVCAQTKHTDDLFLVYPEDLGFAEGGEHGEICRKAIELGFEPCPAEVGLAVWAKYESQMSNFELQIMMEPIVDEGVCWTYSLIVHLRSFASDDAETSLCLSGRIYDPHEHVHQRQLLVFTRK